jgi:hypothetical protein
MRIALARGWRAATVRRAIDLIGLAGCRGVAQPGRALGSGPRGRWFKSSRPDQNCENSGRFSFGKIGLSSLGTLAEVGESGWSLPPMNRF